MLQVGDTVDECKVLSIDKVKRVFDKNGVSKGWVKQYSLQCKNAHIFIVYWQSVLWVALPDSSNIKIRIFRTTLKCYSSTFW